VAPGNVFAAVIGEEQHGGCNEQDGQGPSKDVSVETSLSPGKKYGDSACEDVNPSCANPFKVLSDMLVNYPPSDGDSSSHKNSPSTSRFPKSPLDYPEEGLTLSVRSIGKGELVYSRREKLGKDKLDVEDRSEPALLNEVPLGLHSSHSAFDGGSDLQSFVPGELPRDCACDARVEHWKIWFILSCDG